MRLMTKYLPGIVLVGAFSAPELMAQQTPIKAPEKAEDISIVSFLLDNASETPLNTINRTTKDGLSLDQPHALRFLTTAGLITSGPLEKLRYELSCTTNFQTIRMSTTDTGAYSLVQTSTAGVMVRTGLSNSNVVSIGNLFNKNNEPKDRSIRNIFKSKPRTQNTYVELSTPEGSRAATCNLSRLFEGDDYGETMLSEWHPISPSMRLARSMQKETDYSNCTRARSLVTAEMAHALAEMMQTFCGKISSLMTNHPDVAHGQPKNLEVNENIERAKTFNSDQKRDFSKTQKAVNKATEQPLPR